MAELEVNLANAGWGRVINISSFHGKVASAYKGVERWTASCASVLVREQALYQNPE